MSGPYLVEAACCTGVFAERRASTLDGAIEHYREMRRKWPGRDTVFVFSNLDEVDEGTNGLTEDEEDLIHAAVVDFRHELEGVS